MAVVTEMCIKIVVVAAAAIAEVDIKVADCTVVIVYKDRCNIKVNAWKQ